MRPIALTITRSVPIPMRLHYVVALVYWLQSQYHKTQRQRLYKHYRTIITKKQNDRINIKLNCWYRSLTKRLLMLVREVKHFHHALCCLESNSCLNRDRVATHNTHAPKRFRLERSSRCRVSCAVSPPLLHISHLHHRKFTNTST